ncbi:haloacid dehalogenase [Myriangium duriaei CBS 260.36]|uniref:Haloacid dehalogenase n=1 Tax=Myriangium duriaei CBS 260.36 TaxID=1168546 RepID=A0A9P4MSC0_9PEZI|nr:haloacid dehalogenase [Myriangium duriaei CBS 260.36]
MSDKIIVAFDAYGTLLSTASIAKQLASHFGEEKAEAIATSWRKYQLEYTWRLNSMNQYEPFSQVTRNSLQHALRESNVSLGDKDVEGLMKAYDTLDIFPDVGPCLSLLGNKTNIYPVVFSNGTQSMVESSVFKSPQLQQYSSSIKSVVTVEKVKRYKPHPDVYDHLARQVGKDLSKAQDKASLWLVSGNPFDIVGARAMGMKAAWVDRSGAGWQDALMPGDGGQPTVIVSSLEQVVDAVCK